MGPENPLHAAFSQAGLLPKLSDDLYYRWPRIGPVTVFEVVWPALGSLRKTMPGH